jgi:hypothetical protein
MQITSVQCRVLHSRHLIAEMCLCFDSFLFNYGCSSGKLSPSGCLWWNPATFRWLEIYSSGFATHFLIRTRPISTPFTTRFLCSHLHTTAGPTGCLNHHHSLLSVFCYKFEHKLFGTTLFFMLFGVGHVKRDEKLLCIYLQNHYSG